MPTTDIPTNSFFSNARHNRSHSHADRIHDVLADGPLTVTEIAISLNLKPAVVRRNLRQLRHDGLAHTVAVTPDTHLPIWELDTNR